MVTQAMDSIIHRKAQVARDQFEAREMSPVKALRLSLARAADRLFGLALTVTTVEQTTLALSAIEGEFAGEGLLALLEGGDGARGAVKLDLSFVVALVEIQTVGAVRPGAPARRPVTRTDAAMAAPLIEAMISGYDEQLHATGPDDAPVRFTCGDMAEDSRALSLVLEAQDFDLFRIGVDLGEGAKTGVMTLLMPMRHVPEAAEYRADDTVPGERAWQGEMARCTLDAQATLETVLARISLPLDRVCGLAAGAVLPLQPGGLENAQLLAPGSHLVARVQLGHLNGMRAVRLLPARDEAKTAERDWCAAESPVADAGPVDSVPDPDSGPVMDVAQMELPGGAAAEPGRDDELEEGAPPPPSDNPGHLAHLPDMTEEGT